MKISIDELIAEHARISLQEAKILRERNIDPSDALNIIIDGEDIDDAIRDIKSVIRFKASRIRHNKATIDSLQDIRNYAFIMQVLLNHKKALQEQTIIQKVKELGY